MDERERVRLRDYSNILWGWESRIVRLWAFVCGIVCGIGYAPILVSQGIGEPEIARAFNIRDYHTDEFIRLTDFDGEILVLDFFAWWCNPCRTSSPDLKAHVDRHYQEKGGNAYGIPVTVLPVNVERDDPDETEAFVEEFGLNSVAYDFSPSQAYAQFAIGGIPLFVVINGVNGSASHRLWEVVYRGAGYPGASTLREVIDSVQGAVSGPPVIENISGADRGLKGGDVRLLADVKGIEPLTFQWLFNDAKIPDETRSTILIPDFQLASSGEYSVEVSNSFGTTISEPVTVNLIESLDSQVFPAEDVGRKIPDGVQTGINSLVRVENIQRVFNLRLLVDIDHSYRGDIQISLKPPNHSLIIIKEADLVDDSSGLVIDRLLSELQGIDPRGVWRLNVADLALSDEGVLKFWQLLIESVPGPRAIKEYSLELFRGVPRSIPLRTYFDDWILQSTGSLGEPWKELSTNSYRLIDQRIHLLERVTEEQKFFRLSNVGSTSK